MKFACPRATLSPLLARLGRIVERGGSIPILRNARLVARDDTLTLTATDLDLQVESVAHVEIIEPGETTVDAALLSDIVRKMPDGALKFAEADARMVVTAGRSRFTLGTLPASDFPDQPFGAEAARFKLPAKALLDLLHGVAFAQSSEETRYYLNGVYLHAPDEGLRAVATDGHRLARYDATAPNTIPDFAGIILPRKAVTEIAKLAADHDGEVDIALSERMASFGFRETTLTTKLVDGTFPDYQRVIPRDHKIEAVVNRAALIAALDRVCTVSAEKSRAVKWSFIDDTLTLSVTSQEIGDASESIEALIGGGAIEIGFNGRYALDMLAVLKGERIIVHLNDPGSPALFNDDNDGDDDLLAVLMPMRV